PRVVALSSMGANRASGLGMITALSLLEKGFRSLPSPVAFVRAGGFFENFLFGLQAAQGGTLPVFYNPTNRKSAMVATNDIGAEVAKLLTGPPWSGHRVVELGSMVSADEVADQLGQVLKRDVKAFAVPRAGWAEAFEQFGVPKGHTGPAEEMYEAVNAGWMAFGITGAEHVAGTTSARDVFAAAHKDVKAKAA
ncbi:MAG: NmrA family transcriptional regulator, partial [Terriglobales bacterium]